MFDTLAIILMTKYPAPGAVKTRLQPALSAEAAAKVHDLFLRHTLQKLIALRPGELVVCFDPPGARHDFARLLDEIGGAAVTLLPQGEGDLGQRMARAHAAVSSRWARGLFLGVDSPDLPADHLLSAACLMVQADVTLGPCADGGYWCLGLGRAVDAEALLTGIDWSSGREAHQTIERAGRLQYSLALADGWEDVDHIADLRRLIDRLQTSGDAADRALLAALAPLMPPQDGPPD